MSESHSPADSILLKGWLDRGDEQDFRLLVERYAGLVHHVAIRVTGDHALARDAAQGTFILLAKHARALAGYANLGPWLHVVATNQSRNLRRTQMREDRKRKQLGEQGWDQPTSSSEETLLPELDLAMAGLAAGDREVLLLRYYRSLSVREIAETLGLGVEATKKRLGRSVERLRGRLLAKNPALPAATVVAALAGLSNNAKAGPLLAPALCRHVLANVAPASLPVSMATVFFLMNKKVVIGVTALGLILGGATLMVEKSSLMGRTAAEADRRQPVQDRCTDASEEKQLARNKTNRPPAMKDLEERYGQSRTRLATRVGATYLRILEATAAYSEWIGPYDESFNISEAELGPLFETLKLSDTQRTEMEKIFQGEAYRQNLAVKSFSEKLRQDVPALTEALLASDAYARREIGRDAYEAATSRARDMMLAAGAGNRPLPGLSSNEFGETSRARSRPEIQEEMRKILEPEQIRTLDDYLAGADVAPGSPASPTLANILPVSRLEEMDQGMGARAAVMDRAHALMEEIERQKLPEEK